jgi:hypothetical protein
MHGTTIKKISFYFYTSIKHVPKSFPPLPTLPLSVIAYKTENAARFSFENIRREKLRVALSVRPTALPSNTSEARHFLVNNDS